MSAVVQPRTVTRACKQRHHSWCQRNGAAYRDALGDGPCECLCHQRAAARAALRAVPGLILKEEAECCMAKRDELGRPPIGYCGPDCVRRRR